ncbi:MAG: hypothetical protein Q9171_002762 [Xanthocarpia ochracea]
MIHPACFTPSISITNTPRPPSRRKTVTSPVTRFARQIAGHGYIVAAPSSYHEFVGPAPLAYDNTGTEEGNELKVRKVCGHLAFRCAFDKRVAAAVCYFATDVHSHSLGEGKNDDSLERAGDISGEIIMVNFVMQLPPG